MHPHVKEFSGKLLADPELGWIPSYVLRTIDDAFVRRDTLFPLRGSGAMLASEPIPEHAIRDEFAQSAVNLIKEGPSDPESNEVFGYMALLATKREGHLEPRRIARTARQWLWLECNSGLALLTFAAKFLDPNEVAYLAGALADLLSGAGSTEPPLSRGEQYAALGWLKALDTATAASLVNQTRRVIIPSIPEPAQSESPLGATGAQGSALTLSGTLAAVPQGPVATALSAFTGWLIFRQVANWTIRIFLAYRANAEVRVTRNGLEIHEKKSLLGRQFRERTSVFPMQEIRRLSREVRYARAGTYAGLVALGIGSFLGMRLFVDGLRVPGFSGPLLWLGLLVVVGGLCLDFLLVNWLDAAHGRCRFVVVTERGRGLCLADVEPAQVDAVLSELAKQLVKPG